MCKSFGPSLQPHVVGLFAFTKPCAGFHEKILQQAKSTATSGPASR